VGKTYYDTLLLLLFKLFLTCLTNGCVGMCVCVCVRDAGAGEIQRVLGVFWLPASISSDAAAHHDAFHRSSACVCRRFRWYLSTHTRAQKLWDSRDLRTDPRSGGGFLYSRMLYKADLHVSLNACLCLCLSPAPVGAFALQEYMDLGTWPNLHHAVQAQLFSAGDPRNMSDVSVPRP
jgi:hypothetical protein